MGKAAIKNPYLDTLGGGERYTIEFARVLASEGYDVDVEWQDNNIKNKIESRFGFKIPKNINFIKDIKVGQDYDICFWVSDGSIPTLRARKNIIHFQVPFKAVSGRSLINKMKLFRVNKIVCNSNFTKKVIDEEFGVSSEVLYPPIDLDSFKPKRKENRILYVGRFSNSMQSKGQSVLISEFRKLYKNGFKNWKLILAGGANAESKDFLNNLKKASNKYPIEIIENPSFNELKKLYGVSKLYWSASGFGMSELKSPEKVEHFGMTVIEAMSAGVVPVVVNLGGHKETVNNGIDGFVWNKVEELVKLTKRLINEKGLLAKMSKNAKESSVKFNRQKFEESVKELIK